uniref:Uncharacterized protein n=1 Tax=Arundo donax TaxID=35708 RepID=A0A0A9HC53_ARUDO
MRKPTSTIFGRTAEPRHPARFLSSASAGARGLRARFTSISLPASQTLLLHRLLCFFLIPSAS